MLQLLASQAEREAAQRELQRSLEAQLRDQGEVKIGYQGGGGVYPLRSNGPGTLWYAYSPPRGSDKTPRHWNSFGIWQPGKPHAIVVEINIPSEGRPNGAAGFFARDLETGALFLLHDGSVGGGRAGIGKDAFLAWMGEALVAATAGDQGRAGILVAEVGAPGLSAQITRFVDKVGYFKQEAASGRLSGTSFRRKVELTARYRREFAGAKSGGRSGRFSYRSWHGGIVHALYEERVATARADEEVGNSVLIDLFVLRGGLLSEVCEVKCAADRQTLYGAIGQLLTHTEAGGSGVRKTLVLPEGSILPADIQATLDGLSIRIRHFRLVGRPDSPTVRLFGEP